MRANTDRDPNQADVIGLITDRPARPERTISIDDLDFLGRQVQFTPAEDNSVVVGIRQPTGIIRVGVISQDSLRQAAAEICG